MSPVCTNTNHCRYSLATNKTEQQRLTSIPHVISLLISSQTSSYLWRKDLQLKRAKNHVTRSCVRSLQCLLHVGSVVSALRTKRALQVFPRKWPTNLNRCHWKPFQKLTFIVKHEKNDCSSLFLSNIKTITNKVSVLEFSQRKKCEKYIENARFFNYFSDFR